MATTPTGTPAPSSSRPLRPEEIALRSALFAAPSDELRIAVTFRRPDGQDGPTKFDPPMSLQAVQRFLPDPLDVERAIFQMNRMGFEPTQRGPISVSMRVNRQTYEQVFKTKLATMSFDAEQDYAFRSFYYPGQGAPFETPQVLKTLIDDAYIQWPHIYMAARKKKAVHKASARPRATRLGAAQAARMRAALAAGPGAPVSATPPSVPYFHVGVPDQLCGLLNVDKVHRQKTTGEGIRVAMVDSGFVHSHPYFVSKGYKTSVDLAPRATNDATDLEGHGTGESANLLAVAPGISFIGVKVDNDADPRNGASILEGFQQALTHQPHIISLSLGYDLRDPGTGKQAGELPNSLAALEAEVQAAVAKGIIVVFAAGNGHFSFPGMMPDVISAGGVYVDQNGAVQASDYASAYLSKIYPGRYVPDLCGLVGMLPEANYIMLPVPPGCQTDANGARFDGTRPDDGWAVFSGTSAAAPQLAGVCALLLQKNKGLTPGDIKAILRRSSRSVVNGAANPASSDANVGEPANTSDTGAAGAGLVDVLTAWQQA